MASTPTPAQRRLKTPQRTVPPRRRASTAPPMATPPTKRQKTSLNISATLPHEHVESSNARAVTPPAPASAPADTPLRQSSSSRPHSRPTQSQHSSCQQLMAATLPAAVAEDASRRTTSLERAPMKRKEMEAMLREEIDLAVYQYPDFIDEFLAIPNPSRRETILGRLAATPLFWHNCEAWTINYQDLEGLELDPMHEAMATILDTIGRAAFAPDQFRPAYQEIVPLHSRPLQADDPNDTDTTPDLVQAAPGPDNTRHWGDVHFFAECKGASKKKKPDEQMSEALLQLARYARATLIHQIHRLHVFSIAVCNTVAIFVRIGRTGIIHSPPIDLREDFQTFALAAAGLFALDPDSFGYDSRLYYWPRLTGQTDDHLKSREFRVKTGKKRWTVLEIICQRKCLVGRATQALLLSRISNRRQRAVLKRICRDESRTDEGENLSTFRGCHGICQSRWNEVCGSTAVRKRNALSPSPFMKSFYPPLPDPEVAQIRSSTPGSTSTSVRSLAARTGWAKNQQRRDEPPEDRVYSNILMDEGFGLWRIRRLPHLFAVLRDSVVGLANIVEQKKVHRDISEGNILCSRLHAPPGDSKDGHGHALDTKSTDNVDEESNLDSEADSDSDTTYPTLYSDQDSDRYPETTVDTDLNWLPLDPENGVIFAKTLAGYVEQRYKGPWCAGRLCDFEFMVKQNRPDNEARGKARTGTPAFISAQLLRATDDNPVRHTLLHDLESIFWVLVWMVATHVEPGKKLNLHAQWLIELLCTRDEQCLGERKQLFMSYPASVRRRIRQLENGWELAATATTEFAEILKKNIYDKEGDHSDGENTTSKDDETACGDAETWSVLKSVIDIFDQQIAELQQTKGAGDFSS